MLKNIVYSALFVSIFSLWSLAANAAPQDGYTCILKMQTENQDHLGMNCQVALLEESDFMVYLIGQAYINTHRYNEAKNFYSSYLGTGFDDGARLGLWTLDRFVYGNKTVTDIDLKHEARIKGILRKAMDRSDPMAYYVLKGYKSKSKDRLRYMSEEKNIYAIIDYVFSSKEPFKTKNEYIKEAYESGLPVGKVLYSILGAISGENFELDAQSLYQLSKKALSEGSSCGNLSMSFFYQNGIEVNKDYKEASRLLSLAKQKCWYAENNSDLAWR